MFKLKSSISWNFPSNNDGQEDGLNDPGIETFKDRPLTSLAREILQNSSDAPDSDSGKPVEVHFKLLTLPATEFPGHAAFLKTLTACSTFWQNSVPAKQFFEDARALLKQQSIRVLKISDYNTTGLVIGSKGDRSSDWYKLTKSVGVSDKNAGKLGSFGIGKHAPFACSDFRTVFYGTKDLAGATAFQGVAKLVSHKRDGAVTQGTGYFGIKSGNRPVLSFDSLPPTFQRKRVGADIYIMGFHDFEDWESNVVKSVIENFFMAIHDGNLIVRVGSITVNETSLPKLIQKYYAEPDSRFFADEYYKVVTSADATIHAEADFNGYGPIELRVLEGKDFKKKIAMFRRSGMKIFDKGHFQTPLRFAGVLLIKGVKFDTLLRSLEPPSHDAWQPERGADLSEARKAINALYAWVRDRVRELAGVENAEELDAEGMSQFLPDELEDSPKGTPQVQEELQEEPATKLDMRIRSSPPPSASAPVDNNSDPESEGDEEGEIEGAGEGNGSADQNESDGGTSTNGGGSGSAGNADPTKRVDLSSLRVYCSNPDAGTYHFMFEPKDGMASHLRLFIIGEVGTEPAGVASYSVNGGESLPGNPKGVIGPLSLPQGKRATLDVTLEVPIRCALGVNAYAD
jgi:hypothetical protein